VKSLERGVSRQFLASRRRHCTTLEKKSRRSMGATGRERSSVLSSDGRKCIAESRKRKQVCETDDW
jgi:hypothetical protein